MFGTFKQQESTKVEYYISGEQMYLAFMICNLWHIIKMLHCNLTLWITAAHEN